MEIHKIPALRSPIMIVAFSGWNDAGEAATGALEYLTSAWSDEENPGSAVLIAEIDPEDFYDFQFSRPRVHTDETQTRIITWPSTQVFGLSLPDFDNDLVIVKGVEPSMRWKSFTNEILDLADDLDVCTIITLGSLLADIPHSRPIGVNVSAASAALAQRLEVELSLYEGPTGILGILHDGCTRRGIDSISLWAPGPHYASNAPSPKASLALIQSLEDFLSIAIPQDDLENLAQTWEKEVNVLAAEDSDVADYIKSLEDSRDAEVIPEASGEMIAKEFERYLRRQQSD